MRRSVYGRGEPNERTRVRPRRSRSARNDFQLWLANASAGDSYIYHSGLLMADRRGQIYVNGLAGDAYKACEAHQVALTQRRRQPGSCDYIATRI